MNEQRDTDGKKKEKEKENSNISLQTVSSLITDADVFATTLHNVLSQLLIIKVSRGCGCALTRAYASIRLYVCV